jgi:hypothetical protein
MTGPFFPQIVDFFVQTYRKIDVILEVILSRSLISLKMGRLRQFAREGNTLS